MKNRVVDFIFEDKSNIVDYFNQSFCLIFWLNTSKFCLFHQKPHKIGLFSPLGLNLPNVHTQTSLTQFCLDPKEGYSYFHFRWECSLTKILPSFLLSLIDGYQKRCIYFRFFNKQIIYIYNIRKIKCSERADSISRAGTNLGL